MKPRRNAGISLEGMKKITKNSGGQCPEQDSNWTPPEHKSVRWSSLWRACTAPRFQSVRTGPERTRTAFRMAQKL